MAMLLCWKTVVYLQNCVAVNNLLKTMASACGCIISPMWPAAPCDPAREEILITREPVLILYKITGTAPSSGPSDPSYSCVCV